ncbi:inverse autotransporter beta domain-containing protein [Leptolyngbya sp. KIOST-1]|uniref:inverse autotransporter beta domain-containing protein n=1 Tax=Leptolyngbya sp. KIOST-1 TaxID=1229172 RepID=UPI000A531212|nr:inverse autotransporter beta domain-containing protein [Leptolyngbya sp. KIOST-1]
MKIYQVFALALSVNLTVPQLAKALESQLPASVPGVGQKLSQVVDRDLESIADAEQTLTPSVGQAPTSALEAQTVDTPSIETLASPPTIRGRFNLGHNSSSAGADGLTQFGGFVPLWQVPGHNVVFLEGSLLLQNSGNLGGNAVLGYRQQLPEQNRTVGGYVAFDNRNTGQASFNQLGFGVETLGETWDLRLNAYLPVGTARQLIESQTSTLGAMSGTARFQGNSLFFDTALQNQVTNTYQAALGGMDIEVGGRLLQFANGGDLRGYISPYYLSGPGVSGTFGIRGRLSAQPSPGLELGMGVQHDEVFGTNLLGSVRLSLPGGPGRSAASPEEQQVARLGAPLERSSTIKVDVQNEVLDSQLIQGEPILALNPATGQPWFFIHVVGDGNGDGSIESPLGNLSNAVAVAQPDGNHIIYVRVGNVAYQGNLTVPDNVRLWSTGPQQQLDIAGLGSVNLPESGAGALPVVLGELIPGNSSQVFGFVELIPLGNVTLNGAIPASDANLSNLQAQLSNNGQPVSALETFLELAPGELNGLGLGTVTQGSALKIRITAPVESTAAFGWNFLTSESTPEGFYNDFSFVSVSGNALQSLADTNFGTFTPTSVPGFNEETGSQTFSFGSNYPNGLTFSIGVVDVGDTSVRSGLLLNQTSPGSP